MGGESKHPHGPKCACVRIKPPLSYKARLIAIHRYLERQIILQRRCLRTLKGDNVVAKTALRQAVAATIEAHRQTQNELKRLFPEIDFTPAKKK